MVFPLIKNYFEKKNDISIKNAKLPHSFASRDFLYPFVVAFEKERKNQKTKLGTKARMQISLYIRLLCKGFFLQAKF